MQKWRGIVWLLPLLIAPTLPAAIGNAALDHAARELARRIPPGLHSPVALAVRSLSDLGAAEVAEVRRLLDAELRGRGLVTADGGSGDEVLVALSQNFAGYLLVAEIKRGEERQVILQPWTMPPAVAALRAGPAAVVVEKTLLAAAADPILDIAAVDAGLLLLEPGRVLRLALDNGRWMTRESAVFPPSSLPRDARGRLVVQGGAYLAYLPGVICSGAVAPLDARCREADEAWPLGHEPALRAWLAHGRDYFDGRVNVSGLAKSLPPFYNAAAVEAPTGRFWIFTRLDGRAYMHDGALEPLSALPGLGSEIAGIALQCAAAGVVLATRPGDGGEKDSLHAYQIVDRQVVEAAPPVDLPGPVTALWPVDAGSNAGSAAIAVSRDSNSGEYAAYRLAITCSH